jgi:LPS O-antigen subunit length determinant protein (WzzB/FepE family)
MSNAVNEFPPGISTNKISFIDLFAVLLQWKLLIIGITLAAIIGVVAVCVISLILPSEKSFMPNEYTPHAYMLINDASSSGGGLSSMLNSSGLGGLASMAGVSLPSGSTYSKLAVYLTGMNTFLDAVVDEFDLITRYKIQKFPRAESRKALKNKLIAEFDSESGVFSIGFTDIDPAFAQSVVNFSVGYLEKRFDEMGIDKNKREQENLEVNIKNTFQDIQNLEQDRRNLERSVSSGGFTMDIPSITIEISRIAIELDAKRAVYSQLKVQYELLKVSMASEAPVFQVLELAEIPDQKSGPGRGMLCIIVTFAAGFFSVFLVFMIDAVLSIRNDPDAMSRLKGRRQ